MIVSLRDKRKTVLEIFEVALQQHANVAISFLCKLLRDFSSSFIAVTLGNLHYRALDPIKTQTLKQHKGNYGKFIALEKDCTVYYLVDGKHTAHFSSYNYGKSGSHYLYRCSISVIVLKVASLAFKNYAATHKIYIFWYKWATRQQLQALIKWVVLSLWTWIHETWEWVT